MFNLFNSLAIKTTMAVTEANPEAAEVVEEVVETTAKNARVETILWALTIGLVGWITIVAIMPVIRSLARTIIRIINGRW